MVALRRFIFFLKKYARARSSLLFVRPGYKGATFDTRSSNFVASHEKLTFSHLLPPFLPAYEIIVGRRITAFRCLSQEGGRESSTMASSPLLATGGRRGARVVHFVRGDRGYAGRQRNRGDLPIKIFCLVGLNSFLEGVVVKPVKTRITTACCASVMQDSFCCRERERTKVKKKNLQLPSFPSPSLLSGSRGCVSRSEGRKKRKHGWKEISLTSEWIIRSGRVKFKSLVT